MALSKLMQKFVILGVANNKVIGTCIKCFKTCNILEHKCVSKKVYGVIDCEQEQPVKIQVHHKDREEFDVLSFAMKLIKRSII